MLKLDLHVHSQYSEDGSGTPQQLIDHVQKKGLQGIAITDHNTLEGSLQARKLAPKDFVVIPGIEISTTDGHMIALNVTSSIAAHKSVEETVDLILDHGGIPVVPHVFRNMSGIKKDKLNKIKSKISVIEVFNGCSLPKTNLKTAHLARKYAFGGTGGSDAHDPIYAGFAYTTVDTTAIDADTIIAEIVKKKTWGEGTTMPLSYRRDRMALSIKQFFTRGFKRI
ncbi:MAG: CehA/McbA family metallohydrolase [Candidatus Thermoplasmatota archaeon]